MNSQNRMNAGAEYVLYRIWATLQERNGIHAESLLTCVGALAGYSCQACVRQTAALPGADPAKYALKAVETLDGATYFDGDALNVPLAESPLSVWSLVSRAVQKLGKPLPDIEGIFTHVSQTVGTSAFGVPRVPRENRARHPAIVYLEQVWPQILPIAQRFCTKPAQIPVLFGIALQRAIEQTQSTLSPTLSATIAMECAVAMSKVALPGAAASPAIAWPAAVVPQASVTPMLVGSAVREAAAESAPMRAIRDSKPTRTAKSIRTPQSKRTSQRRRAGRAEASAPGVRPFAARLSPAARVVTIVFLAIITIAGVMYRGDRGEGVVPTATAATEPRGRLQGTLRVVSQTTTQDQIPTQEEPPLPEQPIAVETEPEAPSARPEDAAGDFVFEDRAIPQEPQSDGSAEIVIPPEDLN